MIKFGGNTTLGQTIRGFRFKLLFPPNFIIIHQLYPSVLKHASKDAYMLKLL